MFSYISGIFPNMVYFGIIDELLQELKNVLQSVLEAVFGNSVKPLFEDFVGNIGTFLMDALWNMIVTSINVFLYNTFLSLLFILDLISYAFDIFIGTQEITIDTSTKATDTLFNLLFYSQGIGRAFWGITIIACILCVFFTIYAVFRSMMDLEGRKPVGKVLGLMGKSMLTFLIIPFICMAGLNLSTLVLTQSAKAITGTATDGKVSLGTLIFTSVSKDAMRQHVITPGEATAEVFIKLMNSSFMIAINPVSGFNALAVEAVIFTAGAVGGEIVKGVGEWDESSPGMAELQWHVINEHSVTLNSREANILMEEHITELFNNGGTNSVFARLTNVLGFGYMPYMDTAYVMQYIKPHLVHSLLGIICTVCIAVFMFMGAFIFARRIFEILLLYIVSPYFAAMIPLDDGHKFKVWRDQFISKVLSGYGIVLGMRIFLLMVPVIFSSRVRFVYLPILDDIIRLIILIASAYSVLKAHTLISKILGGEGSGESEAGSLGGSAFSMALSPVTNMFSSSKGGSQQSFSKASSMASSFTGQSFLGGSQSSSSSMSNIGSNLVNANTYSGAQTFSNTNLSQPFGYSRGGAYFARPQFGSPGISSSTQLKGKGGGFNMRLGGGWGQTGTQLGGQKLGVSSQQPGLGGKKPGLSSQQPGLGGKKPELGSQQSGLGSQQPGLGGKKPGTFGTTTGLSQDGSKIGAKLPQQDKAYDGKTTGTFTGDNMNNQTGQPPETDFKSKILEDNKSDLSQTDTQPDENAHVFTLDFGTPPQNSNSDAGSYSGTVYNSDSSDQSPVKDPTVHNEKVPKGAQRTIYTRSNIRPGIPNSPTARLNSYLEKKREFLKGKGSQKTTDYFKDKYR